MQNNINESSGSSLNSSETADSPRDEQEVAKDTKEPQIDGQELEPTPKRSMKKIIAVLVAMFVIVPSLAFGSSYFINKASSNNAAKVALSGLMNQRGDISPLNTEVVTFKGQSVTSATVGQKALTNGLTGNDSGVFAFSNGKDNADKKIVDLYVDFYSQRSRDFLLINQTSLKKMVENNLIVLKVHPVPSGSAFSAYASEAVAQSFVVAPDKSWDLIIELLKASTALNTDKADDVLKAVEDTTKKSGIKEINAETIKKGTFASWLLAVGDDKKLETGYYPPIAYVNDKVISPDVVDFNDSTSFQKNILK